MRTTISNLLTALPVISAAIATTVSVGCGGKTSTTQPAAPTTSPTAAPTREATPIPPNMGAITPALVVSDVDKALAFYAEALGATTQLTLPGPDGKTMHAEFKLGDSTVMLSSEDPGRGVKAPTTLEGTNGSLLVYVEDVDAAAANAVDSGATLAVPAADMFWGDRYAGIVDPFGHMWGLATHKEELSADEMAERGKQWSAAMAAGKPYKQPAIATPAKNWKPTDYATVTLTLLIGGGEEQLAFYTDTLGATLRDKMVMPDGRLMHAALELGGDVFHLSSEFPAMAPSHKAAANLGGSPVSVHHYVADVDASVAAAVKGGAVASLPVTDMFWGDRWGQVKDPSGTDWGIATRTEELSRDEILTRMNKQFGTP